MRIDEKFLTQEAMRTGKPNSTTGNGPDFSETLAKVNQKGTTGAASTTKVSGASEMLGLSPVGSILAVSAANQSQAVTQLDQALDTLDKFAGAMADSTKTLKDLAPLISDLKQHAEQLNQTGRQLPEGDPLRSMMNDTAVLATVEAAKFNRGDFA